MRRSRCSAWLLRHSPRTRPAGLQPAGGWAQAAGGRAERRAAPRTATQTEAELDRADKEDSGRGLEFAWLNAELGPQYVGLQALKADNLVDGTLVESKGVGMGYGAGLGVRLLAFTFGARFRFGNFSDWQLWTLGAEAGMHIPLGRLEPYFSFGAGYASLGGFNDRRRQLAQPERARPRLTRLCWSRRLPEQHFFDRRQPER